MAHRQHPHVTRRPVAPRLLAGVLVTALIAGTAASLPAQGNAAGAVLAGTALAGTALAGTWTFDRQASAVGSGRGGGVPGFPQASQLVIRVTAAEIAVDSDTGSAGSTQTSIYRLDGSTTDVPGPLGWKTTAKAAWQGESLVVTVRRTIDGPNGPIGANVTDTYSVAGTILTVERRLGATVQKLIYNRKP